MIMQGLQGQNQSVSDVGGVGTLVHLHCSTCLFRANVLPSISPTTSTTPSRREHLCIASYCLSVSQSHLQLLSRSTQTPQSTASHLAPRQTVTSHHASPSMLLSCSAHYTRRRTVEKLFIEISVDRTRCCSRTYGKLKSPFGAERGMIFPALARTFLTRNLNRFRSDDCSNKSFISSMETYFFQSGYLFPETTSVSTGFVTFSVSFSK